MTDTAENRWLTTRWVVLTLGIWAGASLVTVAARWSSISGLALYDTDDNLRLAQVRAWMNGQGWFDLVQYRFAPPGGADIHWSRVADLPIAALITVLEPLIGGAGAERWAVAVAPLLPMAVGLMASALIGRRLLGSPDWPLAPLLALCALQAATNWMPLRIDHHGWQLALLLLALAGLVDASTSRGGATAGLASALSLAIGLEMIVFLALIGAATTLLWVGNRAQASRLRAYGTTLGVGTMLGFLLFASEANRSPVCDALSPVWLSVITVTGGSLVVMASVDLRDWRARLGVITATGAIVVVGVSLLWPECLGNPVSVSPELQTLWLNNVSEAAPLTTQGWRMGLLIIALPLSGLTGYLIALFGTRSDPDVWPRWLACATLAVTGVALAFWQVRAAPAAQLLAVPGAAMFGSWLLPRFRASRHMLVRVLGALAAVALFTGFYGLIPLIAVPGSSDASARSAESTEARTACGTAEALAPIAELPRSTVLAPVDLGPRLILMTHHDAVAGPYHRNGDAILDTFHAFRGDESDMQATIGEYDADYVLLCPGISGEALYGLGNAETMMNRLSSGDAPAWLVPVSLPADTPLRLWQVVPGGVRDTP